MAARVGSPIEVRNYLGHADVAMSLHYSHQVSGRDQEMAAQMSALATRPTLTVVQTEPSESSGLARRF